LRTIEPWGITGLKRPLSWCIVFNGSSSFIQVPAPPKLRLSLWRDGRFEAWCFLEKTLLRTRLGGPDSGSQRCVQFPSRLLSISGTGSLRCDGCKRMVMPLNDNDLVSEEMELVCLCFDVIFPEVLASFTLSSVRPGCFTSHKHIYLCFQIMNLT